MVTASFLFTWDFTRADALFAQIDGRAVVSDDGDVEIQLENILSGKYETIGGPLADEVLLYLRADDAYAARIIEAGEMARTGRIAHDREVGRAA